MERGPRAAGPPGVARVSAVWCGAPTSMGARVGVGSERVCRVGCGLRRTGARRTGARRTGARRAEGPRVRGGAAWGGSTCGSQRGVGVHARESAWGGSRCRRLHGAALVCGVRAPCGGPPAWPPGAPRWVPGPVRSSVGVGRRVWRGLPPCGAVLRRVAWPSCGGPTPRGALARAVGLAAAVGLCMCRGALRGLRDLACGADLRRAVGLCVCGASRVPWGLACGAGPLRVVRALCVWCGLSACGAGPPPAAALPVGPRPVGGF
ncbi:hypothetical protein HMPREF1486_02237 [Streptomyces sp. HPH0547]|nr:hypothetical protein HMPREF1486_02237 [Streptomyces sp. HPH0547]